MMKNKLSAINILLICATLILAIATISVQVKKQTLNNEKNQLTQTLDAYQDSINEMEHDLSLSKYEYFEKYLRDVLGYHKSDEIIFRNEPN